MCATKSCTMLELNSLARNIDDHLIVQPWLDPPEKKRAKHEKRNQYFYFTDFPLTESAKIFTSANAPLIMPKPKPDTYAKICLFSTIRELSDTNWSPFSVSRKIR